jgi:hypothetical protein
MRKAANMDGGDRGMTWQPIETAPKDKTVIQIAFWPWQHMPVGNPESQSKAAWHNKGWKKVVTRNGKKRHYPLEFDCYTHWKPAPDTTPPQG